MTTRTARLVQTQERIVKVADWAVDRDDVVLVTLGLGSCVAIMLHDAAARVGGMAHVLLPSKSLARDETNAAKFPETAVPMLVERLRGLGAEPRRLVAKLAGGASMFAALMTPGRCGHLMYSAQAENTPAATRYNTGCENAASAKSHQLPNSCPISSSTSRWASLKKMDSPKPPPNSSGFTVRAPMTMDGMASNTSGSQTTHGLSCGGPPWWP